FDSTETVFIIRILSCVVNCLFSLMSSLGNLLILIVIRKTQDLHLPSFVLVGSLAASDLLVGLICQPLLVALNIAELKKNFNVFCYCRMLLFVTGWTTGGVSLLILTAISVDRLLALTLHLQYNTTVTVARVFQTTFVFWSFCVFINVTRFWMTTKWYFIPLAVFLLSFVVITVCTLNIFKIVRRHQRQINCQTLAVIRLQTNTVNILKCRKSAVTVLYIYAFLGNLLILVVIRKTQDLHLPSFVLVGSLAASDLLVGLLCQPLLVAKYIAELKKNFNVSCYCRMLLFITGWTTAGVSLLILTAISVDRLLALTLHLKYNTTVTVARVFQTTFIFWSFCVFINVTRFWMTTKWYFIPLAVFRLSFVVVTVCTLNIFKIVRRHQRQINSQ
ncbi:unnamed protein product, partial [Porites lobata]